MEVKLDCKQFLNKGENFESYSYFATTYASSIDALEIVDGTELLPAILILDIANRVTAALVNERAALIANFIGRQKKLATWIRSTQTEATLIHLRNIALPDAQAAWVALQRFFNSSTLASIMQKVQKLFFKARGPYSSCIS